MDMEGMDGAKPEDGQEDQNKIKSEGLKFVFMGPKRDDFPNPCPYFDDGDPEMYTKENMEKRKNLKYNGLVRAAIEEFMQEFNPDHKGNVTKEEYMRTYMKIVTILRPASDSDEIQTLLAADWELDSADKAPDFDAITDETKRAAAQKEWEAQANKNYEQLTKEKMYDSLYMLADNWCPSVDDQEIKEFFYQL